jgi:hypothetical protein
LVVYHGSEQGDIEVFAVPEYKGRLYPMFFFSDDDEVAAEYGEHVYSVYLRMARPLVVDAKGADWAAIPRSAIKMRGWAAQDKKAAQEFMEDNRGDALDEDTSTDVIGALAQAIGFDGAIVKNVIDSASGDTYVPTTVYVVFDPTQIKSARENAGTFDAYDPSIYRNPRRNGRGGTSAERTDPELWEAVKREVTAGSKGGLPGQWSARKAQLAVLLYKQRGGGYWGEKSPTNSLAKWTREKWRTKSGRPSLETGERYLPSRAIAALTDAEYRATTRAKREGMRKGQQFVPQPEDVALKVRAYRRNPPHRPLPKRRVLELLADPVSRRALRRFYEALAYYQLPQDYSKEGFREAYDALPEEVKAAIAYRGRKRLWRGDDGQSNEAAISWSTSKSWAKWFGYFLFPFSDLAGYDATIDTIRTSALMRGTEIDDDYPLCDEENEVIVLGARWKKQMGYDELVRRGRQKDRM